MADPFTESIFPVVYNLRAMRMAQSVHKDFPISRDDVGIGRVTCDPWETSAIRICRAVTWVRLRARSMRLPLQLDASSLFNGDLK